MIEFCWTGDADDDDDAKSWEEEALRVIKQKSTGKIKKFINGRGDLTLISMYFKDLRRLIILLFD